MGELERDEREERDRGRIASPPPLRGSSTGAASRPVLSIAHTVASAIARHGLRTRQTSPKSTDSSGIPSQKIT